MCGACGGVCVWGREGVRQRASKQARFCVYVCGLGWGEVKV